MNIDPPLQHLQWYRSDLPEERNQLRRLLDVFVEGRVSAVAFEGGLFLEGNPADFGQEEDEEERGDNTDMLPPPQHGGGGEVDPRPHHDFPQVVRVLDQTPQSMLDKLTLRIN